MIEIGLTMCNGGSFSAAYALTDTEAAVWTYAGTLAGHVFVNTADNWATCPLTSDPTWN